MTLAIASIPEDSARLPRWLEEHIVGSELRALTAELAAVHNAQPPTNSIRDRLGGLLQAVLERGLAALPTPELRHLLRQPYHLIELQEIILLAGGPYWDAVPRSEKLLNQVRANKEGIEEALFGRFAEPYDPPETETKLPRRGSKPYRVLWTIAATAAMVFVATLATAHYFIRLPERGVTWGWAKADAFPSNLSREAYLNRLADEADEWFDKRPRTAAEAAKRIAEFRQGCTALLLMNHSQLTPSDREWLKKRCRTWREMFNQQLETIEDSGDVSEVLSVTDETVRNMSKALRERQRKGKHARIGSRRKSMRGANLDWG